MNSQNVKILKHLMNRKTLNPIQAMTMFGCMRLAARIKNLRNAGYVIISETINKNGKRFSQYRMAE